MGHLSTMAKTVEYVARGLPVVAADLLETRRTAEDAAVYVPTATPDELAKAIDELLDDDHALARMRATGLERFVNELAWDHQALEYVRVWLQLAPAPAIGRVSRDWFNTLPAQREPVQPQPVGRARVWYGDPS
jgi:hypothetical protein